MSDDPVRRAFDVEIALLPGPVGTAERIVATGRRRRQRRVVSLALGSVLVVTSVGVAVTTLSRGGDAQTIVPAQTPDPVVTPSATLSPAPTPTPSPTRTSPPRPEKPLQQSVVLSSTQVAGVRIGTKAAEAERRLRRTLGVPRSNVFTCDGNFNVRVLTWGTLSVYFSEGALEGWAVSKGLSRLRYELPYDGQLGLTVRELLRRLPDGKGFPGEGPADGQYIVSSDRAGTNWSAPGADDRGRVDSAYFQSPGCD